MSQNKLSLHCPCTEKGSLGSSSFSYFGYEAMPHRGFPYNSNICEIVGFSTSLESDDEPSILKLYNNPSGAEIQETLWALRVLFVSRTDKCGLQWHNGCGYTVGWLDG